MLTLNRCRALPLLHPPAPSYHVVVLLNFILYYFFVAGLQDHVPALSVPAAGLSAVPALHLLGMAMMWRRVPKRCFPLDSAEIYT